MFTRIIDALNRKAVSLKTQNYYSFTIIESSKTTVKYYSSIEFTIYNMLTVHVIW